MTEHEQACGKQKARARPLAACRADNNRFCKMMAAIMNADKVKVDNKCQKPATHPVI